MYRDINRCISKIKVIVVLAGSFDLVCVCAWEAALEPAEIPAFTYLKTQIEQYLLEFHVRNVLQFALAFWHDIAMIDF